jgi:hypothetical protein
MPAEPPLRRSSRAAAPSRRRRRGWGEHSGWGRPPQPPPEGQRPTYRRWDKPPYADVEWPFWLLMVSPWLAWGALLLLPRIDICWTCLAEMLR